MHKKNLLKSQLLPKQPDEDKSSNLLQRLKSGQKSAFYLCPNEIQIWYVTPEIFNDGAIQSRLLSWLTPEEQNRFNAFRFERHRQTFLVAHALLRAALSISLGIEPSDWQFQTNAFNKPFIAPPFDQHGLHFNLSHTEGKVALGLTQLGPIGIDVESISRETSIIELAAEILSERERLDLLSCSKINQQSRLLSYWTLKEAFVKATGQGLTSGVKQYVFDLEAHPHPTISFLGPTESQVSDWQFRQYTLPTGHILALAHQQPDVQNIIVTVKEATWLYEIAELG